jgi:hypothetical protein
MQHRCCKEDMQANLELNVPRPLMKNYAKSKGRGRYLWSALSGIILLGDFVVLDLAWLSQVIAATVSRAGKSFIHLLRDHVNGGIVDRSVLVEHLISSPLVPPTGNLQTVKTELETV